MKEDTLAELARKLKISKSTVCKAVRHCSGVDSETRQLILEAMGNDSPAQKKSCPIYAIIPDVPQYFWKDLLRGLMDGDDRDNIPVKYNVYTRCTDEATVLEYLREAEKMDIKVLILAAYVTPEIRKCLDRLVDRCMILLLTEYFDLKNSFFIGADGYKDGYAMGKAFLSEYSDRKLIYFNIADHCSAAQRLNGFFDAVNEEAPTLISQAIEINIDRIMFRDLKILSSRLASLLSPTADSNSSYCVYSPAGMVQLSIALKKAGLENRSVCLCHDCCLENDIPRDGYHICCNQNVYAQGYAASKAAITYATTLLYPENKRLLIPSDITIVGKKEKNP